MLPSPLKPPQMPLTSRVGRIARRSRVVKPASPTSAGRPSRARYSPSSNGSAASAARSSSDSGDDVVVEARDADPAVRALQPGDDLGEGVGRVLDGAAVAARVEVDGRPDDVDLGVHDPAQAERDGRQVALEEARVADDRDVGREPLAVRLEPRVEVDRARLLLALEDVPDVDRHRAAGREERRGGHHVGVDLALVVGRAAGEHPVADDDRLERRRRPQLERVDRLDVVVAVDDDRRGVRGVEPVGVDDRMAAGLGDLDVLQAGRGQRVGQPVGGGTAVVGVGRERRDARDAQERLVRLEARGLRRVEVGVEGGVRCGGYVRHRAHRSGAPPAPESIERAVVRPARSVQRGWGRRSGRLRVRLRRRAGRGR